MMIRTPVLFIVMGFILSSALPVYGQAPVLRSAYHDYRVVDVAQGFERPWSIAFVPGGGHVGHRTLGETPNCSGRKVAGGARGWSPRGLGPGSGRAA